MHVGPRVTGPKSKWDYSNDLSFHSKLKIMQKQRSGANLSQLSRRFER